MEGLLTELTGPRLVRIAAVVAGAFLLWWAFLIAGRRAVGRLVAGEGPEAAERLKRVDTIWAVVRRLVGLLLLALALLTVAALFEIPLASLVVVGSALGVAVGFGAQNFVKDVIAGFFVIVEGQYRIGDVVRIAGIAGRVQDIQLRVTVLRDLDGNVHYVPNGEIKVATNLTQEFAQVVADVAVSYGTEVDRALAVFADELGSFTGDPDWAYAFLGEPEVLGVEELGESAVVLRAVMKVYPGARWPVRRELLRRVKNRFDAEGIEIPFPQRTLHLGGIDAWREVLGRG